MEKIKLGDLCNPCQGQIKVQPGTIIDYIDISSIDNNCKTVSGYQTMTFAEAPSRARKAVKKGNILVSTVRPNLNAVAIVEDSTPNMTVASTGFCVLDCKENVDKRFVFNFCKSKVFIDEMVAQATGASYPAVSDKIVRAASVPSYSFHDQIKIGEILDKVTLIIAKRKSELIYLDNLVKARFVEMFVGKDYPMRSIDDLSLSKGEYGAQSASIEYDSNRPRYVRITDINDDGTLNDDVVSSSKAEDDVQYKLVYGDFIFARMGATVGKTYAYKEGNQIFAGYLIRYKLNLEKITPEYLFAYTRLDEYWNWVKLNQSGAAQPGINAKKYGSLKIPVPPLSEQKTFRSFIQQIDKSKAVIQKSLDEAQLLFDSLMQQYFG